MDGDGNGDTSKLHSKARERLSVSHHLDALIQKRRYMHNTTQISALSKPRTMIQKLPNDQSIRMHC